MVGDVRAEAAVSWGVVGWCWGRGGRGLGGRLQRKGWCGQMQRGEFEHGAAVQLQVDGINDKGKAPSLDHSLEAFWTYRI